MNKEELNNHENTICRTKTLFIENKNQKVDAELMKFEFILINFAI